MGRRGKDHRNIRSIIVDINQKIVQIDLNSNERIRNKYDLNRIPSMNNPNPNIKKIRRTRKIQQTKEANNKQTNNTNNIFNNYDHNQDSLDLKNNLIINETTINDENEESNIFQEFNGFDENLFENNYYF